MTDGSGSVTDMLDRLDGAVQSGAQDGDGKTTASAILDAFGDRSYGPFLLIPALIELSPIGGIPFVPTILAAFILTAAAQMLLGREHIWVPGWVERRPLDAATIRSLDAKLRRPARWLDRHTRERLMPLTSRSATRVAALLVMGLCLLVPPLELVPFASAIPMAAIALFGLALLAEDGLLMLLAFLSVGGVAAGLAALVL